MRVAVSKMDAAVTHMSDSAKADFLLLREAAVTVDSAAITVDKVAKAVDMTPVVTKLDGVTQVTKALGPDLIDELNAVAKRMQENSQLGAVVASLKSLEDSVQHVTKTMANSK